MTLPLKKPEEKFFLKDRDPEVKVGYYDPKITAKCPYIFDIINDENILSTSVSGSLTHWFKNTLDYKLGSMIIVGGVVGTIIGISTFTYFKEK